MRSKARDSYIGREGYIAWDSHLPRPLPHHVIDDNDYYETRSETSTNAHIEMSSISTVGGCVLLACKAINKQMSKKTMACKDDKKMTVTKNKDDYR